VVLLSLTLVFYTCLLYVDMIKGFRIHHHIPVRRNQRLQFSAPQLLQSPLHPHVTTSRWAYATQRLGFRIPSTSIRVLSSKMEQSPDLHETINKMYIAPGVDDDMLEEGHEYSHPSPTYMGELDRFEGDVDFSSHLRNSDHEAEALDLQARQLALEEDVHEQAVASYARISSQLKSMGRGTGQRHVKAQLLEWYDPLCSKIVDEINSIRRKETGYLRKVRKDTLFLALFYEGRLYQAYGPFMLMLPPEKLAVIALDTTVNMLLVSGNQVNVNDLTLSIGKLIEVATSQCSVANPLFL
jgi:hypothetical protein